MAVRACEAVGAVAGGSCGCMCASVWPCGGGLFRLWSARRVCVRLSASAVVCPVVSVPGVVLSWVEILRRPEMTASGRPRGSAGGRLALLQRVSKNVQVLQKTFIVLGAAPPLLLIITAQ